MRRLITLLVIALVGVTAYGFSSVSSGLSVNGVTVSNTTFRGELSAIASAPVLQCYLDALNTVSFTPGAGGASITAASVTAWANLRVEGMAITQYAKSRLKFRPSASTLASAKSSLESELTQAALAKQYHCPGTAQQALDAMPAEMRSYQIEAQAASLFLVTKLNTTIPLTTASMKAYYASHVANYDTICVSIALVAPTSVAAFAAAQSNGATVAQLARQFSVDPSRTRAGVYGCYPPTNSSYTGVRADVASTPLDTFPKTPQYISYNGGTYALFVALTKRTVTPYDQAGSAVLADLRNANASSANTIKQDILYQDAISVDPAFGRWGLSTTGPMVFAPGLPSSSEVTSVPTLTSASATPYK